MTVKHTPLPWVRGEPESNDSLATIRTADGGTVLAEVFYCEGHGTREQAEADLAHMLAAPILADALERALEEGDHLRDCPFRHDEADCECWRSVVHAALRAAGRRP